MNLGVHEKLLCEQHTYLQHMYLLVLKPINYAHLGLYLDTILQARLLVTSNLSALKTSSLL